MIVALAPVNLVVHGFFSMNAVDVLVWEVAFVALSRTLRSGSRARWLGLGTLLGIGLLNKISTLWLGLGLFAGLLSTPPRAVLRSPWPWAAAALAACVFLPHVLWQVAYGWPTADFMRIATTQKMLPVSPLELFAQQVLVWNPLALPVWAVGFIALLRRPATDPDRVFAIVFATTAALLIASGTSRPNYLALAVPPLVAAGAIAFERASLRPRWSWLLPTATALIAGGTQEIWERHWGRVEAAAVWDCGYCLPGRNHSTVWIARDPRTPLEQLWPALRHYR